MDSLPSNPILWVWWFFSVVVVGILINIASPYIQSIFEKTFASISETKRQELQKRQKDFQEKVSLLLENQTVVIETQLDIIYAYLRIILVSIIGIVSLLGISFLFSILMHFSTSDLQTPIMFIFDKLESSNDLSILTTLEQVILISKYLLMSLVGVVFIWKISRIANELKKISIPFTEFKTIVNRGKPNQKAKTITRSG